MMPMPRPILICIRIPCAFVQKVVLAVQFLYFREKLFKQMLSHLRILIFWPNYRISKPTYIRMVWALQLANTKVGLMCNISGGMRKNVKETLINVYFLSLWRETERERETNLHRTLIYVSILTISKLTYIRIEWAVQLANTKVGLLFACTYGMS